MGATFIEKLLRRNTGIADAKCGDIVTANVDRVMIHDIFIPFVKEKFEEMGFTEIWDPDKVVLIYDHLVPASQLDDPRHHRIGNEFAAKYGLTHVHRSDGICHQLMTEAGYVKPGNVVFGTDSHTTTYGCVGAFSSGIGYTEMASILGTGTLWVKIPETIKVVIDGELPEHVTSKDVILRLIGVSAQGEVQTNEGRIDLIAKTPNDIYIVEFKLDRPAAEAMAQIRGKDYAGKYALSGKRITLIGISFSAEKRTIVEDLVEEL